MGIVIIQIFNVRWKEIKVKLPYVKNKGFTHIQISPVQKHCSHIVKWHRVYQPVGTVIGNSLGSKEELQELIMEAHKEGLKIIVDVVLHHTTACPFCNPCGSFKWFTQLTVAYSRKWRGLTISYDRFNCQDWGPKEDISSPPVIQSHTEFLRELIRIGADGFRFDAAKHMPSSYIDSLYEFSGAKEKRLICYGEVMDGNNSICMEYTRNGLHVMNFPLVFALIEAFKYGNDIRDLTSQHLHQMNNISICAADCHDSIVGNSYGFADNKDGILALCFLFARGQEIPLVFHTFLDEVHISAGIQFFHTLLGIDWHCESKSTNNLLFIRRGNRGLAIINKSNEFVDWPKMEVPGLVCGTYLELVCRFDVNV